jgi:putative serine protease PepD
MDPDRSRRRRRLAVLTGLVVVLAGVAAALIANGVSSPSGMASGSNSNGANSSGANSAAACQVTNVANDVLPSVVTIAARGSAGSGTGSGEMIRSDGYILTNNHVIAAGANAGEVHVLFADGTTVPATIVGRDVLTDLAVLKVQPPSGLKPISLGSSASLRIGQPVVALGAPLGLSGTVTSGIVSALDRTVEVPAESDRTALLVSAIQTDAAINPGNSGGALVNCEGQLVGVPTAGAVVPSPSGEASGGSIGLGFAIPIDLAEPIANEIISTGRVSHAYFGLESLPIPPHAAAQAGVSQGLFVAAVTPGGPAVQAGLAQGDIITKIEGEPARTNTQLAKLTLTKKAGDQVSVTYERDGQSHQASIRLGNQP